MGCFPRLLKIGKICPTPKLSLPTDDSNYRPISLSRIIPKVFEWIIPNQLKQLLNKHQVLSSTKSGYCKGRFCVTILHKLHSDIQTLNKGEVTLAVMAYYNKAFDKLTFSTLIKKWKMLKFSNSFIDMIIGCLSDYQQFVQIDDRKSPNRHIKFGVPQGTIVGPTLLNVYVHDLTDYAQSSAIQFANDSTFYKSFKATQVSQGAKDLKSIQNWSNQKNLIFNVTKTKSILFSTHEMSNQCYFRHMSCQKDISFTKKTRLQFTPMKHVNTNVNRTCKYNWTPWKIWVNPLFCQRSILPSPFMEIIAAVLW